MNTYNVQLHRAPWSCLVEADYVEFQGGTLAFYDEDDRLEVAYGLGEWRSVEFRTS